jgi:hypothetical protein
MATLFAKLTDNEYQFTIRRHVAPKEISNLWELKVQGPNDKEPITLIDADSLSTVLTRVQYIFEADGL